MSLSEAEKAARLAAWLEAPPDAPLPEGLEEEVLSTVLLLRPERAPAPRVSVEDILSGVRSGPFASVEAPAAPTPARVISLEARRRERSEPPSPHEDSPAEVLPLPRREPSTEVAAPAPRRRAWWAGAGLGIALSAAAAALIVIPQLGREGSAMKDPLAEEAARVARGDLPPAGLPADAPAPEAAPAPAEERSSRATARAKAEAEPIANQASGEVASGLVGGTPEGAVGGGGASADSAVAAKAAPVAPPAPAGYGSGAGGLGTEGGAWRSGPGAQPAPEAGRSPQPAVGSTPLGGEVRKRSPSRSLPEMDADLPDDLSAVPASAPVAAAPAAPAKEEAVAERKASAPARSAARDEPPASRSAAPGAARADSSEALDAEARSARQGALPRAYVQGWWQGTSDVAAVFRPAERETDPRLAAEAYLRLADDSRVLVAQDARWRAALRLRSMDPARALSLLEGGLARGGAGTDFRANLVVLRGDLLWAAGRRAEALAVWRGR